jgi:hypothetical protein
VTDAFVFCPEAMEDDIILVGIFSAQVFRLSGVGRNSGVCPQLSGGFRPAGYPDRWRPVDAQAGSNPKGRFADDTGVNGDKPSVGTYATS